MTIEFGEFITKIPWLGVTTCGLWEEWVKSQNLTLTWKEQNTEQMNVLLYYNYLVPTGTFYGFIHVDYWKTPSCFGSAFVQIPYFIAWFCDLTCYILDSSMTRIDYDKLIESSPRNEMLVLGVILNFNWLIYLDCRKCLGSSTKTSAAFRTEYYHSLVNSGLECDQFSQRQLHFSTQHQFIRHYHQFTRTSEYIQDISNDLHQAINYIHRICS